jgi:hypothetical protein
VEARRAHQEADGALMDIWKPIVGFEGYSVSDHGLVRNEETGRILTVLHNQYGNRYVGLSKDGIQHRRSLPLLVATSFVKPAQPAFHAIIHRDTNKENNRADNLMWRPQWFAVKYWIQAKRGQIGSDTPVVEIKHQEIYPNSWEACLAFGLLESDLILSIINRTVTWPTFQEFRYLAK